jgi:hypothetical protein
MTSSVLSIISDISIKSQLPSTYNILLRNYKEIETEMFKNIRQDELREWDEDVDSGLFRVYWLICHVYYNPSGTRSEMEKYIREKFKINNRLIDEESMSMLLNPEVEFITSFDRISTSDLAFLGI